MRLVFGRTLGLKQPFRGPKRPHVPRCKQCWILIKGGVGGGPRCPKVQAYAASVLAAGVAAALFNAFVSPSSESIIPPDLPHSSGVAARKALVLP